MADRRPWRCKNKRCGIESEGGEDGAIPAGWIGVRRYPGSREDRAENIGVACCLDCAIEALTQLARAGVR